MISIIKMMKPIDVLPSLLALTYSPCLVCVRVTQDVLASLCLATSPKCFDRECLSRSTHYRGKLKYISGHDDTTLRCALVQARKPIERQFFSRASKSEPSTINFKLIYFTLDS